MTVTGLELVVLALAAYRASRALALDSITERMRDWLEAWAHRREIEGDRPPGWPIWRNVEYVYGDRRWFRGKVSDLISCGFCCSFWLAGITYAAWCTATSWSGAVLVHLITWWAIAGVAALMIAFDSFLLREAPPS